MFGAISTDVAHFLSKGREMVSGGVHAVHKERFILRSIYKFGSECQYGVVVRLDEIHQR